METGQCRETVRSLVEQPNLNSASAAQSIVLEAQLQVLRDADAQLPLDAYGMKVRTRAIVRCANGHAYLARRKIRRLLKQTRGVASAQQQQLQDRLRRDLQGLALAPLPRRSMPSESRTHFGNLGGVKAESAIRLSFDRATVAYHDRIREAVYAQLELARRRTLHATLVGAFEAASAPDPEKLAFHCLEAGDGKRAATYAAASGDQAARTLAFDRAAAWFEQALSLTPETTEAGRVLRIKLLRWANLSKATRGGRQPRSRSGRIRRSQSDSSPRNSRL